MADSVVWDDAQPGLWNAYYDVVIGDVVTLPPGIPANRDVEILGFDPTDIFGTHPTDGGYFLANAESIAANFSGAGWGNVSTGPLTVTQAGVLVLQDYGALTGPAATEAYAATPPDRSLFINADPPSGELMTSPNDTAANSPDTTVGGGGDFTPGSDDPAYRAPDAGVGGDPDGTTTDTSDQYPDSGGADGGAGRTGDVDTHLRDPRTTVADTTVPGGEAGGIGRVGDTDDHTKDPQALGDTTQLGGGVGASSTGQAYRAPSDPPGATNFETSGRAGVMAVSPDSPDAALVGDASGINPNAVEPADVASGYDAAAGMRDTTYAGSPAFTSVPAQAGTPGAPGKPTITAITGRVAVHVAWTAPADAVAKGVVGYIIETNTGGQMEVGKNHLQAEFEQGLVPGNTYTFTVYARTSNGTGPRSAPSDPYTVPKVDILTPDSERDEGL